MTKLVVRTPTARIKDRIKEYEKESGLPYTDNVSEVEDMIDQAKTIGDVREIVKKLAVSLLAMRLNRG